MFARAGNWMLKSAFARHFSKRSAKRFEDYVIRPAVADDCKQIVNQKRNIFDAGVGGKKPKTLSKFELNHEVQELQEHLKKRTNLYTVAAIKSTANDVLYKTVCASSEIDLYDTKEVMKFTILDSKWQPRNSALLCNVYTMNGARRLGMSTKVLMDLMERATKAGKTMFFSIIATDNTPCIEMHKNKLGFQEIPIQHPVVIDEKPHILFGRLLKKQKN